ncbi:MAG: glycogen synthase GlgA [bacterium]|nr:glycogen synthase GlgA [bacterium]
MIRTKTEPKKAPTAARSRTRAKTVSEPRLKVLMVTAEAAPFAKVGGLGDVAGTLPPRLAELGMDVRVVLPCYREVRRRGHELMDTGVTMDMTHAGKPRHARLFRSDLMGTLYWFLDEPGYFDREGVYGPAGGEYPDSAERFSFLCRGAVEAAGALNFFPDILHVHDWHGALAPLYAGPGADAGRWARTVSILTIHNMAYQGVFGAEVLPSLNLPQDLFIRGIMEHRGDLNFLKAGIEVSDLITTVSPAYAAEITTAEYGCGLEGVLARRADRVHGVLNGIDYEEWDPSADSCIEAAFSVDDSSGRRVNRDVLRKQLGLNPDEGAPLFAFVGRLTDQKGADLLAGIVPKMVEDGSQVVVLGSGEPILEKSLMAAAQPYPGRVSVSIGFNERLARRIYAGSDFFLMPSRFEPCGLGQMIAMRYGSLPVVRATGGLGDTVRDVDKDKRGNGILFRRAAGEDLMEAVSRAAELFRSGRMPGLVTRIMAEDHSWKRSAGRYEDLYRKSLELKEGE